MRLRYGKKCLMFNECINRFIFFLQGAVLQAQHNSSLSQLSSSQQQLLASHHHQQLSQSASSPPQQLGHSVTAVSPPQQLQLGHSATVVSPPQQLSQTTSFSPQQPPWYRPNQVHRNNVYLSCDAIDAARGSSHI